VLLQLPVERGQDRGMSERLSVEVLGPLRVCDAQGHDITPDGHLQRRLLALLVLRRGHIVSTDTAIDALWPGAPPRDPVAALQNHLFRLRRALPAGLIESIGDGYRLDASLIEVDADHLVALVAAGETDDAPDAPTTLDAILERWHGPAYAELDEVDDAQAESTRLDELRVRALEARSERRLDRGDTDGLVAELAALADAEPLRERPRALLMRALAATGRQVEALRVYDDFRRLLSDELGIEPSPVLAADHAALLAGSSTAVARDLWSPATRLPQPAAALIGRDALVAELLALVPERRLTTLVGPGGVGKTRLVTELGHRLRDERLDRPVVMCELAPAVEDSAVDLVASALGIDGRPGVALDERIVAVLGDSEAVVLLDNCEHVLEPIAVLAERLVVGCPGVTVVTTSRERLRVPGEQVVAVPPLSAEGEDSTAVQLFLERARAVSPAFVPDAAGVAIIGDIVRRLDGLPLAIELAAARLHTLDVDEVAAGLDHRFSLLESGFRTSARHGSLRAAVSWSYDLLDPPLRQTFADLSIFAGSFTVADAAAIGDVEDRSASAALAQLAERSLVIRAPQRRYVLLETLREFGTEQLRSEGRADTTAERHARYQVEWIENADRRLLEDGGTAIAEVDAALPELRAAFGWLVERGEVELAGRLVAALLDYGFLRLRPDVLVWAERVTAADPDDHSPVAARVWVAAAYAVWAAGDLASTRARGEHALALVERAGAPMPPEVATVCGSSALWEGRLADAVAWYRRAVDAATDDSPQRLIAAGAELLALGYADDPTAEERAEALLAEVGDDVTPHAAYVWYCAGEAAMGADVERARGRYVRALELAQQTGASFVTGSAGMSKASIDARHGDPQAAAQDYRSLISHWRRAGMWSSQWTMLRSIAGLLARLGRPRDAAVLEGAVRGTEAGHRLFGADERALADLSAQLRVELGDADYEAALREGAALDGEAAIEHALRSL
jgi:predicted ATPase/DNA-binding SARP family transcriptional activator